MQQVLSACQRAGCVFIRQVTQRHAARVDPTTDVVSAAWRDVWEIRGILMSFFITQEAKQTTNKQTLQ